MIELDANMLLLVTDSNLNSCASLLGSN